MVRQHTQGDDGRAPAHVCYVDWSRAPALRGTLCENVLVETDDGVISIRVYRPIADRLPVVVRSTLRNRYATIEYDDGCICHCYPDDNPIRSHAGFERYSPDDMFGLND